MNDRFSFRAFVNGSCYTSQGDDKEILICLDSVAVFSDSSIGISYDNLIEAINKATLNQRERETLMQYFDDNNLSGMEEWFVLDADILEQCTGLKDKHGRLIYEGDIIGIDEHKASIFFDNERLAFCFDWCGDECEMIAEYQDNPEMLARLEVIGNIHENLELLVE